MKINELWGENALEAEARWGSVEANQEELAVEGWTEEDLLEAELSEEELLAEEQELMISQQQGAWLDGYLDAIDELEEEVC